MWTPFVKSQKPRMCGVWIILQSVFYVQNMKHLGLLLFLFMSFITQFVSGNNFQEQTIYSMKLKRTREYAFEEIVLEDDLNIPGQRKNLRGNPGLGYYVDINIGSRGQRLHVLVDTGSGNFAVASSPNPLLSTYYKRNESSSYKPLHQDIHVPYTMGEWSGELGRDIVNLPNGPEVNFTVNIASITESKEFFINGSHWQGILGLGYAELSRPDSSIEPFFDSLVTSTNVPDIFTIQLCGLLEDGDELIALLNNTTDIDTMGGTLTIGGLDTTLYEGKVYYTPLRKKWYYEVVIMDMAVDGTSMGMDCKDYNYDKTIIDSGTTSLRLPLAVFESLVKTIKLNINPALTASKPVPKDFWTGGAVLCRIENEDPWEYFPPLSITLQGMGSEDGFTLTIPPKQYLRLVIDNKGEKNCYKFGIANSTSGTVLGAVAMEGFYVVFDRQESQIGFAKSKCAREQCLSADCSEKAPSITAGVQGPSDCAFQRPLNSNRVLTIISYVMLSLCVLCLSPIIFMYLHIYWTKHCLKDAGYTRQYNTDSEGSLDDAGLSTEGDVEEQEE